MNKKALNHTIAECIRIEFSETSGELYLVFQVTDEDFKKRVKNNWLADIDTVLLDKKLIEENKE